MNNNENLNENLASLKGMIEEQVQSAWKDGFAHGVLVTCSTLYRTFSIAGLEENNVLFAILCDLAQTQGNCSNLREYIKGNENENLN